MKITKINITQKFDGKQLSLTFRIMQTVRCGQTVQCKDDKQLTKVISTPPPSAIPMIK